MGGNPIKLTFMFCWETLFLFLVFINIISKLLFLKRDPTNFWNNRGTSAFRPPIVSAINSGSWIWSYYVNHIFFFLLVAIRITISQGWNESLGFSLNIWFNKIKFILFSEKLSYKLRLSCDADKPMDIYDKSITEMTCPNGICFYS